MITIQQRVKQLVKDTPLLEDLLKKGLINHSAFARLYKKDIEEELMKPVQKGAIVMALKRVAADVKYKDFAPHIFDTPPELLVRSNLFELTVKHTPTLSLMQLLSTIDSKNDHYFLTFTEGVFESTIIASAELKEQILKKVPKNNVITQLNGLSAITIRLPKENLYTPGVYYMLLKPLAWGNINIIEVVSTTNEDTIILSEDDVDRAFVLLKNLFKSLKKKE